MACFEKRKDRVRMTSMFAFFLSFCSRLLPSFYVTPYPLFCAFIMRKRERKKRKEKSLFLCRLLVVPSSYFVCRGELIYTNPLYYWWILRLFLFPFGFFLACSFSYTHTLFYLPFMLIVYLTSIPFTCLFPSHLTFFWSFILLIMWGLSIN